MMGATVWQFRPPTSAHCAASSVACKSETLFITAQFDPLIEYTLSFCVATYTVFKPFAETTSGWPKIWPSTTAAHTFPNWVEFTFDWFKIVSVELSPSRQLSLCQVSTLV